MFSTDQIQHILKYEKFVCNHACENLEKIKNIPWHDEEIIISLKQIWDIDGTALF